MMRKYEDGDNEICRALFLALEAMDIREIIDIPSEYYNRPRVVYWGGVPTKELETMPATKKLSDIIYNGIGYYVVFPPIPEYIESLLPISYYLGEDFFSANGCVHKFLSGVLDKRDEQRGL